MLRRFYSLALVGAVAFGAAACDDDATAPRRTAELRVLHASPDAPYVDVYVDGQLALQNVAFTESSGYLEVRAGARNIQVRVAGTSTTVIDVTPTLQNGGYYTAIAKDLVASIGVLLLEDDNTLPASGEVKVRLVHGAPSAPSVDIYVTAPGADINAATPVLTNVPFEGVSPYLSVPAGNYQVRITPTGTKTVAIDSGTLELGAGEIRTAVAVDNTGGGAPFGAVLLADRN